MQSEISRKEMGDEWATAISSCSFDTDNNFSVDIANSLKCRTYLDHTKLDMLLLILYAMAYIERRGVSPMALVTIKDLSSHLSVKVSTLYSWVHNGSIPFRRLNGLIRFDMTEIEAWVKASQPVSTDSIGSLGKTAASKDIDRIVRKSIDSAKGIGYNLPNGKPGQRQGLRKEV